VFATVVRTASSQKANSMHHTSLVTVERLLACMDQEERCTRAEIMTRLDAGLATVQHMLNICVARGLLQCTSEARHHVWWKTVPPDGPVFARSFAALRGYDEQLQRLAGLSMAARPPRPRGQVIRYGVGQP
jgi:hypothetical protein